MKALTAYPYQNRAVRRMWLAMAFRERLLLVAPTGTGKTVIAATFIRAALRKRKRVLFVAHVGTIIDQAYNAVLRIGLDESRVGVIMDADAKVDGHRERVRPNAPVQICGVQTLARRDLDLHFDVVIVDEAHHAEAATYQALLERFPRTPVFGLTATPNRADGKGLRGTFNELHVVAEPSWLIRRGKLANPTVYSAPPGSVTLRRARMKGVPTRGKDYALKQLGEAMNHRKLVGNLVTEWQRLAKGRRTVVFASGVTHSLAIAARFMAAGIACEHIDGKTDRNNVSDVLRRLETGETTVVANYGVLGEGWHQSCVKCVVLARPTKSLTVYLQQTGRISSPWRGMTPIVLDHAGNAQRFGVPFPATDREWSLDDVPKQDGEAPVKVCPRPQCLLVQATGYRRCPGCGYKWPRIETPEETAERLAKMERESDILLVRRLKRFVRRVY